MVERESRGASPRARASERVDGTRVRELFGLERQEKGQLGSIPDNIIEVVLKISEIWGGPQPTRPTLYVRPCPLLIQPQPGLQD
jgi:hypothetical protein